jgi:outer membrane protein TolC
MNPVAGRRLRALALAGVALCAAGRVRAAAASEPLPLTLDEAMARALARNYAIVIERDSYASAGQRVRAFEGAYDFELGLGAAYARRTDPVNSLLSGAPEGEVAPDLRSLDFDVSLSRLLPSGGSLSLLAAGGRARTDSNFSLLSPSYASSFGLELRQPLLRGLSIDPVRLRIQVARSEKTRSLAGLKRTIAETLAAVDGAYWALTAAQREIDVRAAAVALAEQQLQETSVRIGAGTLPQNEEAQPRAELERRRGELFAAREQAVRAENALKALILDEGADPLWERSLVPSDRAQIEAEPVDVAAELKAALELRPEVEAAQAALEARGVELRGARDDKKPRLDAFAAYARRGLAGSLNPNAAAIFERPPTVPGDLDGGFSRSLGTLGDGLYPDARLGVSLTVPIGNRTAKANAAIAEAGERQAAAELARVRQTVRVEVLNAAAAAATAAERVGAARSAREAAEIQFRSEEERFAVGMSTNFLVLTRQNDLSSARLDEIQAVLDRRRALTELRRAAGRLLQDRNVVVAEEARAAGASGGPKS